MSGGGPHVEDASQDATRTGLTTDPWKRTKKVKEKGKERKERRERKGKKEGRRSVRKGKKEEKKKEEERRREERGRTAVPPGRWFPDPPSRLVPNLQVLQSTW